MWTEATTSTRSTWRSPLGWCTKCTRSAATSVSPGRHAGGVCAGVGAMGAPVRLRRSGGVGADRRLAAGGHPLAQRPAVAVGTGPARRTATRARLRRRTGGSRCRHASVRRSPSSSTTHHRCGWPAGAGPGPGRGVASASGHRQCCRGRRRDGRGHDLRDCGDRWRECDLAPAARGEPHGQHIVGRGGGGLRQPRCAVRGTAGRGDRLLPRRGLRKTARPPGGDPVHSRGRPDPHPLRRRRHRYRANDDRLPPGHLRRSRGHPPDMHRWPTTGTSDSPNAPHLPPRDSHPPPDARILPVVELLQCLRRRCGPGSPSRRSDA